MSTMSTTDIKETGDNPQKIDVVEEDWFCRTQQWIKKQDFVAYGKKKYFIPHLLFVNLLRNFFIHPVYFLEFDVNKILFQVKSNKISQDWKMELAFLESVDQEAGEDQDEADDLDEFDDLDEEVIEVPHEKPGSDLMQEPSESDIEFLYELRTVITITL